MENIKVQDTKTTLTKASNRDSHIITKMFKILLYKSRLTKMC